MRPLEDLQYILPEPIRNLANKKTLLIIAGVCVFLGVACISLIAVLATRHLATSATDQGLLPQVSASKSNPLLTGDVCLTTTCLEVSAAMSKNMDPTIDPCDNFYQYACGGWIKQAEIPPNWPDFNVNDVLRQDNSQRQVNVLFSHIRRNTVASAERKMKQFYDVCSHDYGRMKQGGKALIDIIKTDMGGWYLFDPDNWKTGYNMVNAVTLAHSEFLVDILFTSWISVDKRDRDSFIIRIGEGGLGFRYYYYHRQDKVRVMDAYKDYMKKVANLLMRDANVTMPTERKDQVVQQFVDDAFNQEYRLAQGMKAGRQAGSYHDTVEVPLRVLTQNYTQLNWRGILGGIYGSDVNSNTEVSVQHLSYLQHMNEILANETSDRDRMLNNYIMWRLVDSYAHQLSWEYQIHGNKLLEAMYGYAYYMPSWEQCLYTVRRRMSVALASEIIKKHVKQEGRDQAETIVKNLYDSLVDMVKEFKWMDNITLSRALEKLSKVQKIVGFPNDLLTESYVDDLYADLVINKSLSYLKNLLNTNTFMKDAWRRQLQQDRTEWYMEMVQQYNMFASSPSFYTYYNKLIVPAGTIRMPLFVPGEPRFYDYGALGSRIGRVAVKAVDSSGRYSWHNGSMWNWWTENSYKKYRNASQCFSDYISNVTTGPYLIDGQNVSVPLPRWSYYKIMREVPGLKLAYKAYQKLQGTDRHPPGLNTTNIQSFFIAAVQTKCVKYDDEEMYENAVSGYPTAEIFLNHALMHMDEFADTFKCAKDRPMYLEKKCDLY